MIGEDIVATGTRHITEVRAINRELLEKTLRMRCLAYLTRVKADLLTDTIFSIQESKNVLKQELKHRAHTAKQLRDSREHLEDLVTQRTSALTRANRRLEQEIGERDQAQRALRESEARVRLLLDSTAEAIYGLDLEARCTFANPACVRSLGYATAEQLLGKNMHALIHHTRSDGMPYPEIECRIYQGFRGATGTHGDDEVLWRADGSRFPVEYWSYPMLGADGLRGSVVTFLDITERRRAEQERLRLESQLSNSQKMEALGRLASGIAHDFNNVLTGILGYAELAQGALPEQSAARSDLDEVLHGVLRARNLVAQVLAFSRQAEGEPQPLALGSIVTEASRLVSVGLGSAVEVRVEMAEDVPVVRADATQMYQMVMNLCTNAGQAMPEGGLLEVSLGAAELDEGFCASHPALDAGRFACLTVRDSGCGMPPEVLERIFEPYFTTREASGGTGLGLALVHGIVSELGGTVTARSEVGHGTEIRVYLPADAANEAMAQVEAPEEAPPRGNESILFVDDEVQVRTLMRRGLEQLGYSVTACATGAEALARMRSDPARFDLVITDLTMPGMNGIELARTLRQLGVTAPIILCTGFARESTREAARTVGVQQLVPKPVGTRDLARAGRRLLDEAAALH